MQFEVLGKENEVLRSGLQEVATAIRPLMRNLASEELSPIDQPQSIEAIVKQCKDMWPLFKDFVQEAGRYVAATVLAIARSYYPRFELERIEEGLAANTSNAQEEELRNSSMGAAARVMEDIRLIDEGSTSGGD